jgi:hypothetical protein
MEQQRSLSNRLIRLAFLGALIPTIVTANTSLESRALQCGEILENSVSMIEDLDCRDHAGPALIIRGTNKVRLNGNGFRIFGPSSDVGVLVASDAAIIERLELQGWSQGIGIFVVDSESVVLRNNILVGQRQGIHVYAGQRNVNRLRLEGNVITDNGSVGLFVTDSGLFEVVRPVLRNNYFARANDAAIAVRAARLYINDCQGNVFRDTSTGIDFRGGRLTLENVDLSASGLLRQQVYVADATKVRVINSRFQADSPLLNTGERTGLNLYRVQHVVVRGSAFVGQDTGVKIATDNSVKTKVRAVDNQFLDNEGYALFLQSYDSTAFGRVRIKRNVFSGQGIDENIVIAAGTQIGPDSRIVDNEMDDEQDLQLE